MRILPAPAGHGIVFKRNDIDGPTGLIPGIWSAVSPTRLCTQLFNEAGVDVRTVEHVMAALAGTGVHNALIEVSAAELPILDGSAAPYVTSILAAGLKEQFAPVIAIEVLREVTVREGQSWARLSPARGFVIDFEIEFADAAIGAQRKTLDMANGAFVRELCDSRTFCRFSDVQEMHASGLARGGDLSNALVVDGEKILTPGGARHEDEAVRHKMLDALGDLALAGAPLRGRFSAHRGGHSLTNQLLRALFDNDAAYREVTLTREEERLLPGVGLNPRDLSAVA